jgi:hypothetical protein
MDPRATGHPMIHLSKKIKRLPVFVQGEQALRFFKSCCAQSTRLIPYLDEAISLLGVLEDALLRDKPGRLRATRLEKAQRFKANKLCAFSSLVARSRPGLSRKRASSSTPSKLIPQPNISLAHAGKGFLVASDRTIWRMEALSYDTQIDAVREHPPARRVS